MELYLHNQRTHPGSKGFYQSGLDCHNLLYNGYSNNSLLDWAELIKEIYMSGIHNVRTINSVNKVSFKAQIMDNEVV